MDLIQGTYKHEGVRFPLCYVLFLSKYVYMMKIRGIKALISLKYFTDYKQ